jgi:retron-type reverse transcriptase
MVNQDNLEKAWVRAKSYAESFDIYYDISQYQQFDRHLTSNLRVLRSQLLSGYHPKPMLGIRVPKQDGHRDLFMLSVWDNVASMALLNVLAPIVEGIISQKSSDLSFGNRFDLTGTNQVLLDWRDQHKAFSTALREIEVLPDDYWYIRSDISDYYPSIHGERVLTLLAPIVDREVRDLVYEFLSVPGRIGNDELLDVPGLPIGPAFSHLFGNLYLASFDDWIKARTVHYVRYVDDFFFASESQGELLASLEEVRDHLAELGLALHPEKTERYPVTETACIEGTIKRLKYNIRMETPELEAAGLQKTAEALLYEAFIDSEFFKLPQTTAFVAWRLQDLGYPDIESLTEVVCEVLESNSLKPSDVRRLLTFVIQNNQSQLPTRLIDYLITDDDVTSRIIALDIIDDFPSCLQNSAFDLFHAFLGSDSFLVRAYAYETLGRSQNSNLTLEQLVREFSEEDSSFVKARICGLAIRLYPGQVSVEVPYWLRVSSEVTSAILNSAPPLGSLTVTRALVPALSSQEISPVDFSSYVYLLMLYVISSELNAFIDRQEIITVKNDLIESLASLAQEAFERLLRKQDHFSCSELLSIIVDIDPNLAVESVDRLRHETEISGTELSARFTKRLHEVISEADEEAKVWSLESDTSPRRVFLERYLILEELIPLKSSSNGLYEVMSERSLIFGAKR